MFFLHMNVVVWYGDRMQAYQYSDRYAISVISLKHISPSLSTVLNQMNAPKWT